MVIVEPVISTMGGGTEIVHVIPLEEEIDRAVRAFEVTGGFRANKVYLLTGNVSLGKDRVVDDGYYADQVRMRFRRLGIEVITVSTATTSILDIISKVSSIVKAEKEKGNIVYVNMSSGGPFVSVGTALATMVQDAKLYYVRAGKLSLTPLERKTHGNAVVTEPQVQFIENFKIQLPDYRARVLLVELYKREKMRTGEVLELLYEKGVEGFDEDPSRLTRGEKITLLMRLNKGITGKLESAGYIRKEKRGRENLFFITESGKYVACVSGLL